MTFERNIFCRGLPSGCLLLYFLRQKVLLREMCKIRLFQSFERVPPSVGIQPTQHGGSEWAQFYGDWRYFVVCGSVAEVA